MKNIFQFPQDIYNHSLKNIAGISFSAREIEIMAHIFLEIETKQMPSSLALTEEIIDGQFSYPYKLSDRTVESHIDKIFVKVSRALEQDKESLKNILKKRDKIKFFIEKSDKKAVFENYCRFLKLEILFLQHLETIFHQNTEFLSKFERGLHCQISYWDSSYAYTPPTAYTYLARHLNDRQLKDDHKVITTILKAGHWETEGDQFNYYFYIIPPLFLDYFKDSRSHAYQALEGIKSGLTNINQSILFLFHNGNDKTPIPKEIKPFPYSHLKEPENYFFSVFEILKTIFPPDSVENEIRIFREELKKILPPEDSSPSKKKSLIFSFRSVLVFLTISVCLIGGLIYYCQGVATNTTLRSDLIVPVETAFLERLEILEKIAKKLDSKENTQIVEWVQEALEKQRSLDSLAVNIMLQLSGKLMLKRKQVCWALLEI